MNFNNIKNEYSLLALRVLVLVLVLAFVYQRYGNDFFMPEVVLTRDDFAIYGFVLIILFSSFLMVGRSLCRIFLCGTRLSDGRPGIKYYYWLQRALYIQLAKTPEVLYLQTRNELTKFPEHSIIGAALRTKDGQVVWSPSMARHAELIWVANHVFKLKRAGTADQGFVTSDGTYVDRKEALIIAKRANQLIGSIEVHDHELFSENLF